MARTTGAGSWIRNTTRLAIYLRDGFQCAAGVSKKCPGDLRGLRPEQMGLDHLICSSDGGGNGPDNCITICVWCNSERGKKDWRKFYPADAQERVRMQTALPLNRKLARALIAKRKGAKWVDTQEDE